ncbi:PE family protein, partial [Mycobacterium intermedium]
MSFLLAQPEILEAAAADVSGIAAAIRDANAAAEGPTTRLLAAAADEVSVAVARLFGAQGQSYQALSAEAAAFQQRFVQALSASAGAYLTAEAASVNPLQAFEEAVLNAINTPTMVLFGRPLIGNGADATVAGQAGGAGGILYGNGGAGFTSTTPGVPGTNGGSAGLIGNGG